MDKHSTFDAMKNEYDQLGESIMRLEGRAERGNGLGLTIIGGALIFNENLTNPLLSVYLIIPFAMTWVLAMVASYWHNVMIQGVYRRALEQTLNCILKQNVFLWETVLVKKYVWSNFPNIIIRLCLSIITISIVGYCFIRVQSFGKTWPTTISAVSIIMNLIFWPFITFPNNKKLTKNCYTEILEKLEEKALVTSSTEGQT